MSLETYDTIAGSIFVGTFQGVFYLENEGTEWKKYGCLPNTSVNDIEIQYLDSGKIFIGTHGRGIFEAPIVIADPLSTNSFDNNNLVVYPNPVSDILTIKGNLNFFTYQVSIFDLRGRMINRMTFNKEELGPINTINYDISNIDSGIYLLVIQNEGKKSVKKIIKE